jgi:hypothetical protein
MKTFTFMCCFIIAAAFVQGQIIHVPADYNTIQAGINAAGPGDTVLVSDGIYYEQINFLGKKPLTVASEFLTTGDENHITSTIIDGSMITDSINGSIVNFKLGEDTTSVLCGFTIRNGNIGTLISDTVEYEIIQDRSGGGIFIFNCGAKIIHNHITENHVVDTGLPGNPINVWGGGVYQGPYVQQEEHWVILDHNVVDHNSTGCDSRGAIGAGIAVESSALITNNDITENIATGEGTAFAWGGGLVGSNDPSLPSQVKFIVNNNTISNNQVISPGYAAEAAGAVFEHAVSVVSENVIENNMVVAPSGNSYSSGMLILRPQEGTLVSGNYFHGNMTNGWIGGLIIFSDYSSIYQDTATVLVENNYFIGNEGHNVGGMMIENSLVILQNNVFSGNHASLAGGAIYIRHNAFLPVEHMVTIINNSFSGNKADLAGGAIFSIGDNPLVINSIFWQDSCAEGYGREIHLNGLYDTVEIANSNIDFNHVNRGARDGGGNINENPQFDNLDLLTLLITSPCIGYGIESYTCACGETHTCPGYDIIGIPRPQSGTFEMGAYELMFDAVPAVVSYQSSVVSYPNPFSDHTTIEYELEQPASVNLSVYNHLGQEVQVLVNEVQNKGKHQVIWDAEKQSAGIYFYRLSTDDCRLPTGKLVVVR